MASEDAIEPLEVMELVFLVSNKLPCSFDTSRRRLSGLQELLFKVVGNKYYNLARVSSLWSRKWTNLFSGSRTANCREKYEKQKYLQESKSLKYRARRSKVFPVDFEDAESSGEVAVSVADDRELDALQQKGAQGGHQVGIPSILFTNKILNDK